MDIAKGSQISASSEWNNGRTTFVKERLVDGRIDETNNYHGDFSKYCFHSKDLVRETNRKDIDVKLNYILISIGSCATSPFWSTCILFSKTFVNFGLNLFKRLQLVTIILKNESFCYPAPGHPSTTGECEYCMRPCFFQIMHKLFNCYSVSLLLL